MRKTLFSLLLMTSFSLWGALDADNTLYSTSDLKSELKNIHSNQSITQLKEIVESSKKSWEELKEKNYNFYNYSINFESKLGGGYKTEVFIENGVIIKRLFNSWYKNEKDESFISDAFVEDFGEINKNKGGSLGLTIDSIYDECFNKTLAKDPKKNRIDVVLTKDNLLKECSSSENGRKDDSKEGVTNLTIKFDQMFDKLEYSTYKSDTKSKTFFPNQKLDTLKDLLSKSKKSWLELKEKNKNSYQYSITFASWTGSGNKTIVIVVDGVVVKRVQYNWTRRDGFKINKPTIELKKEIEKSNNKPQLVDDFYNICETDTLKQNPDENFITLQLTPDNILTGCSYFNMHCADDCSQGLHGVSFKWLSETEIQAYQKNIK
ncbi:hypothetical protein JXR93_05325 [bacterium]|nr:hypothetical protein [bacterium]